MLPYGAAELDAAAGGSADPHGEGAPDPHRGSGAGKGLGLGKVLAAPGFWWLAIPYFVCGVTTTGLIDTHLVPFAHDTHLPEGATALAVVLLAGFNSLGVMIAGYLTDRMPRRYLLAFLYGMRGLTLLFLMTVSSGQALLVFTVIYGLVDFSTVPPTISLASDLLGTENVGLVYGLVSLSHQIGSATGAFVPGLLHDLTHSYHSSFLMGAAALAVAAMLSLWVRERNRKERAAAAAI